jgi:hypothetical protein
MTRGALIFAFNNEVTDYVAMAQWSAENIRRHLDIPVAVVTDDPMAQGFDHVTYLYPEGNNSRHFSDYDATVTWHNESRASVYDLTPWDHTLLLDADYVVASSQLKSLFDIDQDLLAHRWANDITGVNDFHGLNYFGRDRMPQWWATVIAFRKSDHARLIFETMEMIRDNWRHYRELYNISSATYRNDHALSIAINTVSGHVSNHPGILWPLSSLTPEHKLERTAQDSYRITFNNGENQRRHINVVGQDFHAMGKKHLEAIVASAG